MFGGFYYPAGSAYPPQQGYAYPSQQGHAYPGGYPSTGYQQQFVGKHCSLNIKKEVSQVLFLGIPPGVIVGGSGAPGVHSVPGVHGVPGAWYYPQDWDQAYNQVDYITPK